MVVSKFRMVAVKGASLQPVARLAGPSIAAALVNLDVTLILARPDCDRPAGIWSGRDLNLRRLPGQRGRAVPPSLSLCQLPGRNPVAS